MTMSCLPAGLSFIYPMKVYGGACRPTSCPLCYVVAGFAAKGTEGTKRIKKQRGEERGETITNHKE